MRSGEVIDGRFVVERRVDGGGSADLYRAIERDTDRRVALKVLRLDAPGDHARFAREARVLASLEHPAIVKYVSDGEYEGRRYLAMEWVDGETLTERLNGGTFTVAECLVLLERLAGGLAHIHDKGIVHRDVKPRNIRLPNGRPERSKLLDFGIARVATDEAGITSTGAMLGTPGYMPPEQARGVRELDARADIFALGCVTFLCLTGREPFRAADLATTIVRTMTEDAPRLRAFRPEIPEPIEHLVAQMLARDPGKRPSDARALASLLSHLEIDDAPASAPVVEAKSSASIRLGRDSTPKATSADASGSHRALSSSTIAAARETPPSARRLGNLYGSGVRACVAYFERRYGRAAAHAVIARIPSSMRKYVRPNVEAMGLVASERYPYDFVAELTRSMAGVAKARDEDAFVREIVAAGVDATLDTIHRVALRYIVTPQMVAARAQEIWNLWSDAGRVVVLHVDDRDYHVAIEDWTNHEPMVCRIIMEARRRILERGGARFVDARRERCVSWGHERCVMRYRIG